MKFLFKIGGHTTILTVDEDTICKLAKFHELKFYTSLKHLPKELIEYIPKYKGAIELIELESKNESTYLWFKEHLDENEDRPSSSSSSSSRNNEESLLKRKNSNNETFKSKGE